uniref:Homeobox-leucine zipper protein ANTHOCYANINLESS 2 n=1 Tax=Solanum tuberosum TaxID=4113 RepID=M1E0B2_SOLTU
MVLLNLALDALNELFRLYENDKPLWVSILDGGGETLNIKEYARLFTPLIGTKPEYVTTEATRTSVAGTSLVLMNTLMDKVTWIEHMKYNENLVHDWYRPLINTGVGFGAQRWMTTLQRQYQFLKVMKSIVDTISNYA